MVNPDDRINEKTDRGRTEANCLFVLNAEKYVCLIFQVWKFVLRNMNFLIRWRFKKNSTHQATACVSRPLWSVFINLLSTFPARNLHPFLSAVRDFSQSPVSLATLSGLYRSLTVTDTEQRNGTLVWRIVDMLLTEFFPWQPWLGKMGQMRAPPVY